MNNSKQDNSNTILKRLGKDFKNFLDVFGDTENISEETFEECALRNNLDDATTIELKQSLEDIKNGRHLISISAKPTKSRIKKLKSEQIDKVETITNRKMNIQRIETINNNELEL